MASNGLLDNIAGMWPLNNNIFNSLDVVAPPLTQHPFTHEVGATASVAGKFLPGLAKNFATGTGNRMSYADVAGKFFNPGDNSFSLMSWVRATNNQNNPYLAKWDSTDATPNRSWLLWNRSTNSSHRFSISSLGVVEETNIEIANPGPANWQLLICGYDAGNEEIFMSLDGAPKVTTAHTGGASATAAVNLTIGWFQGTIKIMGNQDQDETAYWAGRVLSDADCALIWNGSAGLRMTEWDATVPVSDGTGILTGLVSYFNCFDASGGDRVDLHSGDNDVSETGAGAPINQGGGLSGIANTPNHVDFSSNPGSLEYLEKASPVGMDGGAGSFTVAGFFELRQVASSFQGLLSRWLAAGDGRQWNLYEQTPDRQLAFVVNVDGTVSGTTGLLDPEVFQSASTRVVRFVVAWYDGDADTVNLQVSNGLVGSVAGPASVFNSNTPFQIGHTNNAIPQPLEGGAAFVGYWNRVLTQVQRTFLYNFFGGQTYAALVAANAPTQGDALQFFREPFVVIELEQDQCRLLYGESPCTAALGTTGTRKCYNTRKTCQDTENYDSSATIKDTALIARDVKPQGFDIATTGVVEASFDVVGEDNINTSLFFKSDGTKLFVTGLQNDKVYQYPLTVAWDVSTAGSVEEEFIVPGSAGPRDLFFKPDGLKLFEVGGTIDTVSQYPLTGAWDLSTVGAVEETFSIATEDSNPTSIFFKSDGMKLFVLGQFNRKVFQYPLSTAWDISTAGSVEEEFTPIPIDTIPEGISFKSDGTKLYYVGNSTNTVHQFPLGTAWDISTAGLVEATFDFTSEDDEPRSVFMKPDDGLKLYMIGTENDEVHQYPLGDTSGNDGTIDGAVHVAALPFGFSQALSFDGVDDSVEVLDPAGNYGFSGTSSFTSEFILDPKTIPNSFARLLDKKFTDGGGDQGWRISLRQSDTSIVFERIRDGASDIVSAAVSLLEARFWSAVYDGTDLILYEEGTEKARATSAKSLLTNVEELVIGNDSVGGTAKPYHGTIDEVRTWSVARTQVEIRARMVLPLSGREAGLASYFPFDDSPLPIATRTLRFTKPQTSAPRDLYLLPLLVDVDTAPTRINPGGGSRDRGVLGDRASVDIGFKDAPGSDRVVDKYRTERISGTAQTDEGSYEPLERGTFWAKWRARNLFFQNRRVRILEGYVGENLRDMQRREYFVDQLRGPDADGRIVIRAKDVLKLADDERAQAPRATPGELNAALTDAETTSFQATGALIADYPDEPGLVRIGSEVIEYQTRTQATPDDVQFNTLTRGARGSAAEAHDAEDRVQRCLDFLSVLPWKLAEDLLVNFGNVPAEFIPITDWDAEGDVWLSQFTLSAVITEPTSVTVLLSEITQQAQFFIWWDEHTQTIKLKALRPPTEDTVVLNEVSHLIEGASVIKEHPDQRLSQVWVFFSQKDPTKRLDEEANFARVRIRADLEAESPAQYGESRIKKIFSRWLETEGHVSQVTKRTLDRYRDNPRTLKIRADAKDREALRVGEVADIVMRTILDDRGLEVSTRWQVISAREEPAGEAVALELLEFEFTGRFAFYMETAAPIFADATDQEKKSGAWYAGDDGKFSDGTDGYQYQ